MIAKDQVDLVRRAIEGAFENAVSEVFKTVMLDETGPTVSPEAVKRFGRGLNHALDLRDAAIKEFCS